MGLLGLVIAVTIIGAILIFGGIVYFLLTDKSESENDE